jgi:phage baseplate assembly protein V
MNIEDIVRIGNVDSINAGNGTVRVRFPDRDDKVSKELKVIYSKTHQDKEYHMPDINEIVLCIFLPNQTEEGFILGSFYNEVDVVPANSSDIKVWQFSDGGKIEYNKGNSELNIEVSKVNITAPEINLNGNVNISGNLKTSGTTETAAGKIDGHTHGGSVPAF